MTSIPHPRVACQTDLAAIAILMNPCHSVLHQIGECANAG